jgi:hypothetical protein
VWPIEKPAILRRITRGDRPGAEKGRDYRGENGGVVRVQTLEEYAVL